MIPKIIHYCWFGGKDLPDSALKCIESWKRNMPEYEIKRWDESNFDVNGIAYISEAYEMKKYAFVSDYARFKILYENGGVYFDTDVEIIRPLDKIVMAGPFMGVEKNNQINPGLGMGSCRMMPFIGEMLKHYSTLRFLKEDGSINYDTVVFYTTNKLREYGWTGKEKEIAGFKIYNKDYFCPLDYETNKLTITKNTHTIHHYSATWITPKQMLYRKIKHLFGEEFACFCSSIIKRK